MLRSLVGSEMCIRDRSEYITASLEKHGSTSFSGSKNVGNCSVAYQVSNSADLKEIAECSRLNPYETVEGQTTITSLTFEDRNANDAVLGDVRVDIGIPVTVIEPSVDLLSNITYVVTPGDFIVAQLVNFTEPDSGWESSALHVVVDVVKEEGGDEEQLVFAQLLFNTSPSTARESANKFNRNSNEEERTVILQGR